MYFFIVFILATFGMLYAYFKMAQNQSKGLMEKGGQAESFADFMTGSYDANYLVNPNARSHVRNGKVSKLGAGLIDKKDIEARPMQDFGNVDNMD